MLYNDNGKPFEDVSLDTGLHQYQDAIDFAEACLFDDQERDEPIQRLRELIEFADGENPTVAGYSRESIDIISNIRYSSN